MNTRKILALALALMMLLSVCQSAFGTSAAGGDHIHKWTYDPILPPICMEPGYGERSCEECWTSERYEIPALGHSYTDPWKTIKEPTCTETGTEMNTCKRINQRTGEPCGYQWWREMPALGHDWSEWYVAKEPTPEEDGYEERVCNRCGITEQRPLTMDDVDKEDYALHLEAYLVNEQSVYKEGDTVQIGATATNTGKNTVYLMYFYWYRPNGSNFSFSEYSPMFALAPGESVTSSETFDTTLTKEDIDNYSPSYNCEIIAYAWQTSEPYVGESVASNRVTVKANLAEDGGEYLNVVKTLDTEIPPDGYFMVDDEVTYTITVTNNYGGTVYDVDIFDLPYDSEGAMEHIANFPSLEDGDSVSVQYTHTIDELDLLNGEYVNGAAASATYTPNPEEEEGDRGLIYAEPVTVSVFEEIGDMEMIVEKKDVGMPLNGVYYQEGEEIVYLIDVWNLQSEEYHNVSVYDRLGEGGDREFVDYVDTFPAHGHKSYNYRHTVTAEDCERGYVYNTAIITWSDGEEDDDGQLVLHEYESYEVISDCRGGEIWLRKEADKSYYKEGDIINYTVTWGTTMDLETVTVYDPYTPGNHTATWEKATSGDLSADTHTLSYAYMVTHEDAVNGWVINEAFLNATDTEGRGYSYEEELVLEVGFDDDENTDTVTIEKSVMNTPENGAYFVKGEVIYFKIVVTNTGKYELKDVSVTDPLKGNSEDSVVDIIPVLEPGETRTYTVWYVVTEEDVCAGCVVNTATIRYLDEDDDLWHTRTATATAITGGNPVPTRLNFSLCKSETSVPANGSYYVEGETVYYAISFVNASDVPVTHVDIYDDGQLIASFDDVEPHTSTPAVTYQYTVTKEDAELSGYVRNIADAGVYVSVVNDMISVISNEVIVPCGVPEDDDEEERPQIAITKSVLNPPANGMFYVPGEPINYAITVSNLTDREIVGDLYDNLNGDGKPLYGKGDMVLAPHASVTVYFTYVPDDYDAGVGTLTNYADSYYSFSSDAPTPEYAISNLVTVDVGRGVFDPDEAPVLSKIVTSYPKNGCFYVEGEKVEYDIIATSFTDKTFYGVDIFDVLADLSSGYKIASGTVNAHSSTVFHFTYTVTAVDADIMKTVSNIAWAIYEKEDGSKATVYSNEVIVPTDGVIPPPTHGSHPDHCEWTLVSASEGGAAYIIRYCGAHAAAEEAVSKLLDEAKTDEERLEALSIGVTVWERALEQEYAEAIASADEELARALDNDRVIFILDYTATADALSGAGLSEDEVLEWKIDALRDRVTELCCTLATEPEARKDVVGERTAAYNTTATADCALTRSTENAAYYTELIDICPTHMALSRKAYETFFNAEAGDAPIAYETAKAYWYNALSAEYPLLQGSEVNPLRAFELRKALATFDALIGHRLELYRALYPDDPALACELTLRLMPMRLAEISPLTENN
ncbi:MAG: hypothetical protein II920_01175 [Clostridia bacterium]|nr:hypothetical protein [Clostridia bacterium]